MDGLNPWISRSIGRDRSVAKPARSFYGFDTASLAGGWGRSPFAQPVTRTLMQFSGGAAGRDDCSGTFSFDMNGRIQSGVDVRLQVSAIFHCQSWYRDPGDAAGFGMSLSDGLRFVIDV